jgi:ABC-type nitrate/sulfonate/bicarbonate transport system permease component
MNFFQRQQDVRRSSRRFVLLFVVAVVAIIVVVDVVAAVVFGMTDLPAESIPTVLMWVSGLMIVAIVLTSMPHITVNVVEGVKAIPRELLDMARAYNVTGATRFRHIILPAVAPYVFTAVRFGFAIAWKITALTELFGGREGVGIQIRVKFELFSIAGVLAWAFFLVAFALIMERVVLQRLERRFFRWRAQAFA